MPYTRILLTAVLITGVFGVGCSQKKETSFSQDIHPILKEYCVACHSNDGEGYTKSGLDLASYYGLMKGTKFGPVIVPGDSASSSLILLIEHKTDPSIAMPYHQPVLPKEDIKKFKAWIDDGAKDN